MSKLEPTLTHSNLTATERLRAMLDERGVEWNATVGASGTIWTHWDAFNGHRIHAMDNEDGTVEIFGEWDVTPEQAIAATLGTGTCKADETERIWCRYKGGLHDRFLTVHVMECSECGHTYEHVNGDYEFCPRCGRKRADA